MVASNKRSRAIHRARADPADSCPIHRRGALAAEPWPRTPPGLPSAPSQPRGALPAGPLGHGHVRLTISTDKPRARRPPPRERPLRRHGTFSASEEPGPHNQILPGQPDEPKGPPARPAPRRPRSRAAACGAPELRRRCPPAAGADPGAPTEGPGAQRGGCEGSAPCPPPAGLCTAASERGDG